MAQRLWQHQARSAARTNDFRALHWRRDSEAAEIPLNVLRDIARPQRAGARTRLAPQGMRQAAAPRTR